MKKIAYVIRVFYWMKIQQYEKTKSYTKKDITQVHLTKRWREASVLVAKLECRISTNGEETHPTSDCSLNGKIQDISFAKKIVVSTKTR